MQQVEGPVYNLIRSRVTQELEPTYLIIENESHRHRNRGEAESHFKTLIVSAKFEGMMPVERHRLVNRIVSDEHGTLPCHSLSLKTMTPEQFAKKPDAVEGFQTPPCLGGDGSHRGKH